MPTSSTTAALTDGAVSLHEAAEHLNVHYMTAYRYVKTGELAATQVSRRWMVQREDLDSFRSAATDPTTSDLAVPSVDSMRALMESGDEDGAWLMLEASGSHSDPLKAQQQLIAPALRETGERWANGDGSIAQEHLATVVAMRLISRLGAPQRRGRRTGTVVVCCSPGDTHTLATAIFANLVRGEGADVIDLGPVRDAQDILDAVLAADGNCSVAIAVSGPGLVDTTRALTDELRAEEKIRGILVGGVAIPDHETALEAGSDLYFSSPEMAAAGAAAASRV